MYLKITISTKSLISIPFALQKQWDSQQHNIIILKETIVLCTLYIECWKLYAIQRPLKNAILNCTLEIKNCCTKTFDGKPYTVLPVRSRGVPNPQYWHFKRHHAFSGWIWGTDSPATLDIYAYWQTLCSRGCPTGRPKKSVPLLVSLTGKGTLFLGHPVQTASSFDSFIHWSFSSKSSKYHCS